MSGISVGELMGHFVEDFLGCGADAETKREIKRTKGRYRSFTTSPRYIWNSQIKCRYARHIAEQSLDEKHKMRQEALKVKWLTQPRPHRMYNEHNPDGTQHDWAKELACQSGRA